MLSAQREGQRESSLPSHTSKQLLMKDLAMTVNLKLCT